MADKTKTQQFEYKAEMKQLLNLIVHSLYTHPEVFLRELISNASDALNKIRLLKLTKKDIIDPDTKLTIKISVDPETNMFSIEDTGIGMTETDLINNIGTVAKSGTLDFVSKIKDKKNTDLDTLIGQFGVGFYSVFMVTDNVTIETRNAEPGSKSYKWVSSGESTFTIEETGRKERGTKISFKLKDDYKEFTEDHRIRSVVEKYSNFADFPILLGTEQINKISALWRKPANDIKEDELNEFYKFISNDFSDPLTHQHISVEGAVVNFKALLFIPKTAPFDLFRLQEEGSLHLYANKILIQRDCKELLPVYLRFIKGVVDTIDLPLNVSREVTQSSPLMTKISNILTSKILSFLTDLMDKYPEKYDSFYKNFGPLLKTGLTSDFTNRDQIIGLLKFESSGKKPGELTTLKDYVSRMKSNQKEIYYVNGDNRSAIENNPNLEYFRNKDIEVLLLTDPVDIFTIPSITDYDKKSLKSIDKADIELAQDSKIETPDNKLNKSLLSLFKDVLKDKVADVIESKRLVDSPVTLVSGKDSLDPQTEKMMKLMNKEFQSSKKIMEINTGHKLIKNLGALYLGNSNDPMLWKCINQLYDNAAFMEGDVTNVTPHDFVKRVNEIMTEATKK